MKQLFFLTALILLMSACKDKKKEDEIIQPQVEIVIDAMYGYQFLSTDSTVFTTEEGYDVKLREMKIILTDIRNGNNLLSPAAIYSSKKGRALLKTNGTSANFGNLSFNIGVDATLNHSDPAAFPNDHALNILNASDMHWSWNPGYIFFKVEMIADTLDDGVKNFNHVVTYHVGMDDCFQQKQITGLNWNSVGNNIEQLRLKVDIKRLLQNGTSVVDIKTESATHSAPENLPLSIKLSENFKAALTPF
jgi:hypothetical protein